MKRLNVCVKNELAAAPFRSCCRFDVDLSGAWRTDASVVRHLRSGFHQEVLPLASASGGPRGCSPLINNQQPENGLPPKSKANFGLLEAVVDGRVDGEEKRAGKEADDTQYTGSIFT